jgi:hypothetical protein
MTVFVIGREGRFEVGASVFVQPQGTAENIFTGKKSKYGPFLRVRRTGSSAVSYHAAMVRGVAREGGGFYARVLPADAEVGLLDLDQQIEAKREELRALHEDRQAFLAAHVVRGERIASKHATTTTTTVPRAAEGSAAG